MLFEIVGAKKTMPPEDQPVVQSMRASAKGGPPKNPTKEDKSVRKQLSRSASVEPDGSNALDISGHHDLRPLHTRAAALFLQQH